MAKIYAPNERYTGLIAGVSFINGVGETDDKWLINWFEAKGYKVIEEEIEEVFYNQEGEVITGEEEVPIAIPQKEEVKEDANPRKTKKSN